MEEIKIEFKELDEFTIEDTREVVIQEVPVFPDVVDLEVTPSKETQVFKEDGINYGEVKVLGDEDLVASNIKQGIEIFGVTGALEELTTETKEGINNQEEIIATQESTLEEINEVIKDKILVKEKFKPRYMYQPITFQNYTGTELDHETSMLDTTNFSNMTNMFYGCKYLTELDLSEWNTSSVTKMQATFSDNINLLKLNVNTWNTSNVTTMRSMFYACKSLTELDLSSFITSSVTDMNTMFYNCEKLTYLDIRNFTFDKVTSYSLMFNFVPNNCLIIVKGQTEKQWITSKFSNLKNVKTVEELEG